MKCDEGLTFIVTPEASLFTLLAYKLFHTSPTQHFVEWGFIVRNSLFRVEIGVRFKWIKSQ